MPSLMSLTVVSDESSYIHDSLPELLSLSSIDDLGLFKNKRLVLWLKMLLLYRAKSEAYTLENIKMKELDIMKFWKEFT